MITLAYSGQHVPAFKNTKKIVGGKHRRPMLITDPRKRKIMDEITDSFTSQLKCLFQTAAQETGTASCQQCWTASLMPLDDSLDWIAKLSVSARQVAKGCEGVVVRVEQL